jgi:DNA mismatch repair protein MutS2
MVEYTYQVLGYYQLLGVLSNYASCRLGESDCLSLRPSSDVKHVDAELRLVSEMRLLLKVRGFTSFSGINPATAVLEKTNIRGSFLEPEEFLIILGLIEAAARARRLILSGRELCPGMCDLVRNIPDLNFLAKEIHSSISPNATVKDSASPYLKKVREKKTKLRHDLVRKLESIRDRSGIGVGGQDSLVTIRDGRYVISLRVDQKSQVEGIVHHYSRTKTTCFVEPLEIIRDNNLMAELGQDEKEEERRILIGLTDMLRKYRGQVETLQYLVGRLDGLHARAQFCEDLLCVMPEICDGGGVELKAARNPMLLALAPYGGREDKDNVPVVPVDIFLNANKNVLIISGPNRGGKTVALKTLGLICLMAQAGMHIPAAEGSRLPVFERIMADIGDDQDIQTGQSTFSAHLAHLKYIIDHSDEKSLVIIDEPGMGTDPAEGVALVMATIDLLASRGTFIALSTHLSRLKAYGFTNPMAINAAVEFNRETSQPSFRLNYGLSGVSHALESARSMGISESILDRATAYMDGDEIRLSRLIEALNRQRAEAYQKKQEAEDAKKRYDLALKKAEEMRLKQEEEKRSIFEAKKLDAEAAINEAKDELKKAINLLKKDRSAQAVVAERIREISHNLTNRFETCNETVHSSGDDRFREGQHVFHKNLKQTGVVHTVSSDGEHVTVMLGGLRTVSRSNELEVIPDVKERRPDRTGDASWKFDEPVMPVELNVIGYRVEEAIPLIDRTIDRALVEGKSILRVVHGFGTGRLRRAIRNHLKEAPFVKSVTSADSKDGGEAITVVELS